MEHIATRCNAAYHCAMHTTISERLAARGLGIGEAAQAAGIGRATLWRWIQGRTIPRPPQARALAKILRNRGERLDELTLWIISTTRLAAATRESLSKPAAV